MMKLSPCLYGENTQYGKQYYFIVLFPYIIANFANLKKKINKTFDFFQNF